MCVPSYRWIKLARANYNHVVLSGNLLDTINCTSRRDILIKSQMFQEITVIVHETEDMPRDRLGLMVCHFL